MAYKPQAGAQMAAPNVIPMADIMLVLLIIFMVVTPMLQKTHQVDLASVNDPRDMKDADKDDAIVVAVTRDGSIFLGNSKIKKEEITGQIKDQIANKLDKTVYVNWNALCVSAYLDAARVLQLGEARHFALRSLDRILAEAWKPASGLKHVVAYSDPQAKHRDVPGLLDDYAFTTTACLDAYETTAALSYFNFARRIGDAMIERFYDAASGGFFDVEKSASAPEIGALAARRKPFQDSPTPAGNSAAAIALLRLHAYTHDESYREKAQQTLEVFAGMAEQYGIFAGTYGIAASLFSTPHTQVVVVGSGEQADQLYAAAVAPFALGKSVVWIPGENEATPQNLPPALAETIPNLPEVKAGQPVAVVCSNFTCQPPVSEPEQLSTALHQASSGVRS